MNTIKTKFGVGEIVYFKVEKNSLGTKCDHCKHQNYKTEEVIVKGIVQSLYVQLGNEIPTQVLYTVKDKDNRWYDSIDEEYLCENPEDAINLKYII